MHLWRTLGKAFECGEGVRVIVYCKGSYHKDKYPGISFVFWDTRSEEQVVGNIRSRLEGWINYYGRFGAGELKRMLYHLDEYMVQ